MNLNLDDLQRCFLGCQETKPLDDERILHRIVGPMRDIYTRNGDGAVLRMNCTSGIRIRFAARTSKIGICLRFGDVPWTNSRLYNCAIGVDGATPVPFGPVNPEGPIEWSDTIFRQADSARRTFDIWLPHTACTRLVRVEIEDGGEWEPALPPRYRYLVYGDSITQGMQATLPIRTYPARIALELGAEILNLGVGGAKLQKELADSVPNWLYDFATIAYGTNDINQGIPPETYGDHARSLLESMARRNPGKPIFAISVIPWAPGKLADKDPVPYRKALAAAAAGIPEAVFIDGASLISADPVLFVDGVHPNDTGFEVYARNLLAAIRSHLPKT
jgi:lysophospholipase L1-like esterase